MGVINGWQHCCETIMVMIISLSMLKAINMTLWGFCFCLSVPPLLRPLILTVDTWVPDWPLLYTLYTSHLALQPSGITEALHPRPVDVCFYARPCIRCASIFVSPLVACGPRYLGVQTGGTSRLYSDQATGSWSESPTDPRLAHS